MSPSHKKEVSCPVETTLRIVGGKWKVLVLHELLEGDGVIHRKVYRGVPPRVEYRLTALGETLEPILLAMHEWGVGCEEREG